MLNLSNKRINQDINSHFKGYKDACENKYILIKGLNCLLNKVCQENKKIKI